MAIEALLSTALDTKRQSFRTAVIDNALEQLCEGHYHVSKDICLVSYWHTRILPGILSVIKLIRGAKQTYSLFI